MQKHVRPAVAVRNKGKAAADVGGGEVGEVGEQRVHRHAAPEVVEGVQYGDAGATHAGLAAADARVDGDALAVDHDTMPWVASVQAQGGG